MDIDKQILELEGKSATVSLGSKALFIKIGISLLISLVFLYALRPYYLLSVEIYKTLTLLRDNRPIPAREYLQKIFNEYTKLIESSNPLETAITDKLLPVDMDKPNNILELTHSAEQDSL